MTKYHNTMPLPVLGEYRAIAYAVIAANGKRIELSWTSTRTQDIHPAYCPDLALKTIQALDELFLCVMRHET